MYKFHASEEHVWPVLVYKVKYNFENQYKWCNKTTWTSLLAQIILYDDVRSRITFTVEASSSRKKNAVNIVPGNYDSRRGIRGHSWHCLFKLGARWEGLKSCTPPSGWSTKEGKKIFIFGNLDFFDSKCSLLHNQRTVNYLVILYKALIV